MVERIKQYPGLQQVQRGVQVNAPGKHFPGLTPSEQNTSYKATAVEFTERHEFPRLGPRSVRLQACYNRAACFGPVLRRSHR